MLKSFQNFWVNMKYKALSGQTEYYNVFPEIVLSILFFINIYNFFITDNFKNKPEKLPNKINISGGWIDENNSFRTLIYFKKVFR